MCLTDFPKEPLWAIDRLNDKILSDSRLQSKFATWQAIIIIYIGYYLLLYVKFFNNVNISFFSVTTDRKQLDGLFEILSDCDRQWDGSPFREFKIHVIRRPPPTRNVRVEPWPCAFDVQFKDDGKIGLWNVTTHDKNILDINMSCLDKLVVIKII